ncbi:hypothetical protein PHYBOEH_009895 [Phytophthora boehmeriae]|uniref:Uncharacterized protein n=1 Tax=Phytophthora boehmeriae TaxID=109152 RepID=A0A8T1VQ26_9STRA|nr:hypothetical protein PHYBOEH_009895 [Phytophthora boehmeriae]
MKLFTVVLAIITIKICAIHSVVAQDSSASRGSSSNANSDNFNSNSFGSDSDTFDSDDFNSDNFSSDSSSSDDFDSDTFNSDSNSSNNNNSSSSICSQPCEGFDEYCETSTGECRGPNYDGECFNSAAGTFQDGCDPGYQCINNKCDDIQVATDSPATSIASGSKSGCGECEVIGEYCDSDIGQCRPPSYDGECYNVELSVFQDGCEDGYECVGSVCQVNTAAPETEAPGEDDTCYLLCSAGNYCEDGTNECRGPNYEGECFNPATGAFQDGCDPGFVCSPYNRCENE